MSQAPYHVKPRDDQGCTNEPDSSDHGLKRRHYVHPVLDIDVKKMQLLVSLCNIPILVDPDRSIFHLLSGQRRFMDTDIDGDSLPLSLFLKSQHKLTVKDWAGYGDCLSSR